MQASLLLFHMIVKSMGTYLPDKRTVPMSHISGSFYSFENISAPLLKIQAFIRAVSPASTTLTRSR